MLLTEMRKKPTTAENLLLQNDFFRSHDGRDEERRVCMAAFALS